jgi:hypothetical protein
MGYSKRELSLPFRKPCERLSVQRCFLDLRPGAPPQRCSRARSLYGSAADLSRTRSGGFRWSKTLLLSLSRWFLADPQCTRSHSAGAVCSRRCLSGHGGGGGRGDGGRGVIALFSPCAPCRSCARAPACWLRATQTCSPRRSRPLDDRPAPASHPQCQSAASQLHRTHDLLHEAKMPEFSSLNNRSCACYHYSVPGTGCIPSAIRLPCGNTNDARAGGRGDAGVEASGGDGSEA